MFHPAVRGSYHKMGYGYGSIVYKDGFRVLEQSIEKLDFRRKSEGEVQRVFPEILEEVKGFSEACHASYEQTAAFIFSVGAFKVGPMCSAFAAVSDSDVVFGRNYDFFYSFKKYTESYLTCPKDGYWSLGHTDIFIGREDGVNEKGLAIAMTGVEGKSVKPGVSFCLALRGVLDKCATVDEAVKLLLNTHLSTSHNYLLADKEGNLAVVEASPDEKRVRRPENGDTFIVCTNHFVHPEMQDMEGLEERACSNWDSLPRYATICEAIKQQNRKISAENAQKILSNHSGYVCSHQDKIKLGTIWSVAATLKEPQIFRAEGHPCKTKYKQDLRLDKAIRRRQKEVGQRS
jgi:predicted choloylglycine hydrolase